MNDVFPLRWEFHSKYTQLLAKFSHEWMDCFIVGNCVQMNALISISFFNWIFAKSYNAIATYVSFQSWVGMQNTIADTLWYSIKIDLSLLLQFVMHSVCSLEREKKKSFSHRSKCFLLFVKKNDANCVW